MLSKEQFVDVVSEKLDQVSVIWDSLYSDWDETLEELDISALSSSHIKHFSARYSEIALLQWHPVARTF